MGRAGAGSGGRGGGSGGGHRSSSRSSGGHRVSSSRPTSHRSSASSYRSSSRTSFGPTHSHTHTRVNVNIGTPQYRAARAQFDIGGPSMPPPQRYGRVPVTTPDRTPMTHLAVTIAVLLVFVMFSMFLFAGNGNDVPTSTIVRTKIDNPQAWVNDCVWDEIGWFDNTASTSKRLRDFYEQTGVQPYILLRAYDPELSSDSAKGEWAEEYFDTHDFADNAFLFVYFAERNTDEDVGYMHYVAGNRATAIFDQEAVSIFWAHIDANWYSDMNTDSLFVKVFNDTATSIMNVSTTGKDIVKVAIIGIVLLVIIIIVCISVVKSRKAKAIQAQADAAILAQDVSATSPSASEEDPLLKKYGDPQ